ncbi:MAG TPA: hypothetical protein VFM98_21355 [Ramlibacter sp.]|uniref:hypothetical protein n=1 Tax=Ramlibacter sp. TaxID=1917967 RepID=UPI002D7EA1F0|nr:hypothetical protein [Ramlibacter sp.]HET8748159.1 hypothetical protein [Ramlibacter sp.]
MKTLLRPGVLVGLLAAAVLALTALGAYSLVRLGSGVLAIAVAVAGIAALVAVAVAWSLAREAEEQLGDLLPALPPEPTTPAEPQVPSRGFKVREARPGEVPEPYLAAVMKGAQQRREAWKASGSPPARG